MFNHITGAIEPKDKQRRPTVNLKKVVSLRQDIYHKICKCSHIENGLFHRCLERVTWTPEILKGYGFIYDRFMGDCSLRESKVTSDREEPLLAREPLEKIVATSERELQEIVVLIFS